MWALLLLLTGSAFAQELDLSSIKNLEEKLPDYNRMGIIREENLMRPRGENKYVPPKTPVHWDRIKESGTELGSINTGVPLIKLEDNRGYSVSRPIYVRFYQLEDEHGFKYIVNLDGTTTYRVDTKYVHPIKNELALYEPPTTYTPAPLNLVKAEYDKKLTLYPEAAFYAGLAQGDFMRDLFNDKEARSGITTQYGAHLFTDWKLPIKVGGVLHYEKTTYDLTGGGQVNYTSLSAGPQIKTKDWSIYDFVYRFQVQMRVSPFSRAQAEIGDANVVFNFNSTDLLASFEHPIKNGWGEWTVGAFFQAQWLNFRDQPEIVSVRASNRTNTSMGLTLSQVFE